MSAPINGGPAFPVSTSVNDATGEYGHQTGNATWQCPGMTLRDYFAAHADCSTDEMSIPYAESLIGRPMPVQSVPARPTYWREVAEWWAEAEAIGCYLKADAMLKARSL